MLDAKTSSALNRFKTQVSNGSDFPWDALLWIKEVETVVFLKELKSPRSVCGRDFPNFEMLDAKIASALHKIIQNSYFKKKVSLEEQKAQKEDWFHRGRQIAFMSYDYFRVTGAHDTVLDHADLFSVTLRDDNIQEFDTRWDEVLSSMSKIQSDDILESLYKLRIRDSDHLKTVLELYDMEIHQKISMPKYQKLKTMVKRSMDQKLRLQNFDAKNENKRTVFERRPNAVSGTTAMSGQNRHRKPLHPLSHQHQEVEVRREKGASEARVCLGRPIDSRAETP